MTELTINYCFDFGDRRSSFDVRVDARSLLQHAGNQDTALPEWTRLGFHQCANCPLTAQDTPWCPVAVNLMPLISECGGLLSYQQARVVVTTAERSYSRDTTVQRGLSSLLGLVMATSACPHMRFLRPMAKFHLPFASEEETIFRAVSTWLLSRYFAADADGVPALDLSGLGDSYQGLQAVNRAFAGRLKAACGQDAAVNAVVLLDLFAKDVPYSIADRLAELGYLFAAGAGTQREG
ncbi:MAG: hypothetical protein HY940_07140 [Gammaproteobacteria bacterium]|nr:hypothetical protein [Gammaproteobacteria bacterium]